MTPEERNLLIGLGVAIVGGVILVRWLLPSPSSTASVPAPTPAPGATSSGALADQEPPFVPGT